MKLDEYISLHPVEEYDEKQRQISELEAQLWPDYPDEPRWQHRMNREHNEEIFRKIRELERS